MRFIKALKSDMDQDFIKFTNLLSTTDEEKKKVIYTALAVFIYSRFYNGRVDAYGSDLDNILYDINEISVIDRDQFWAILVSVHEFLKDPFSPLTIDITGDSLYSILGLNRLLPVNVNESSSKYVNDITWLYYKLTDLISINLNNN